MKTRIIAYSKLSQIQLNNALRKATLEGDAEKVEKLIQDGADVNYQGKNNNTVLMIAAARNHIEIVRVFLKYNADTSLRNKQGMSAYDLAEYYNHKAIMELLADQNGFRFPMIR